MYLLHTLWTMGERFYVDAAVPTLDDAWFVITSVKDDGDVEGYALTVNAPYIVKAQMIELEDSPWSDAGIHRVPGVPKLCQYVMGSDREGLATHWYCGEPAVGRKNGRSLCAAHYEEDK